MRRAGAAARQFGNSAVDARDLAGVGELRRQLEGHLLVLLQLELAGRAEPRGLQRPRRLLGLRHLWRDDVVARHELPAGGAVGVGALHLLVVALLLQALVLAGLYMLLVGVQSLG